MFLGVIIMNKQSYKKILKLHNFKECIFLFKMILPKQALLFMVYSLRL